MRYLLFPILAILLGCTTQNEADKQVPPEIINPTLNFRPNIIWLVAEDQSPNIPAFGDSTIVTPTLDRLAAEGICYDNFFSPAPVCAPARSAIITGMYPNSLGSNHMRTGPWYVGRPPDSIIQMMRQYFPEGVPPYEAVPDPKVKMFTEYLRKGGYFTTNNFKQDYQFASTPFAWDENSRQAHWKNRKPGQPFFSVFNYEVTHESRIWAKADDSLWVADNLEVPVPPYLPDNEIGQKDVRRMYSNILEMDFQVGQMINELEEAGLMDSTIIVWYTDHGGPLPRQKRLLHDSGLKVPMIIRYPGKLNAGSRDNRMISFIDLAPTVLSVAGITPPEHMEGQAFLGDHMRKTEPQYIYAAADRFDAKYDQNRAVRDERYKYIRYYQPEKPMILRAAYRDQMAIMQELNRMYEEGELNEAQQLWFRETKPEEELFDTWADPHEIKDLATDDNYREKLEELRAANDSFVKSINDKGLMQETELISQIWPEGVQPKTANPVLENRDGLITINCETQGASIGYQMGDDQTWYIYGGPFSSDKKVTAMAHRLGYLPSEYVALNP